MTDEFTATLRAARVMNATRPTMLLRFIDGVLHQAWEITDYNDKAEAIARRVEYRPVPSEVTR